EGGVLLAAVRHLPGPRNPHCLRGDVRRGGRGDGDLQGGRPDPGREALRHLRGPAVGLLPAADRGGDADDPRGCPALGEDPGQAAAPERLMADRRNGTLPYHCSVFGSGDASSEALSWMPTQSRPPTPHTTHATTIAAVQP